MTENLLLGNVWGGEIRGGLNLRVKRVNRIQIYKCCNTSTSQRYYHSETEGKLGYCYRQRVGLIDFHLDSVSRFHSVFSTASDQCKLQYRASSCDEHSSQNAYTNSDVNIISIYQLLTDYKHSRLDQQDKRWNNKRQHNLVTPVVFCVSPLSCLLSTCPWSRNATILSLIGLARPWYCLLLQSVWWL